VSAGLEGTVDVVASAERASCLWRRAVLGQQEATSDHAEFYALAGELVATVRALDALAAVLSRQVAGYGRGRTLRDDEGLPPGARLADAVVLLGWVRKSLSQAEDGASRFWSAIGHIGVEDGGR
jgi:hypothetical protein